jgi:hypothetical protein
LRRSIAPTLSPLGVLGKLVILKRDVQQCLGGEVVFYQFGEPAHFLSTRPSEVGRKLQLFRH